MNGEERRNADADWAADLSTRYSGKHMTPPGWCPICDAPPDVEWGCVACGRPDYDVVRNGS